MKRKDAVLQGAPLVHELEAVALASLRAVAAATVGLIDLRREAGVSPLIAEAAWARLAETTASAHQGLPATLALHRDLTAGQTRMGCRTVATGGDDKDDSDAAHGFPIGAHQRSQLRAVG